MMRLRAPSPFRILASARGQALLSVMILAVVAASMTGFLMDQSVQSEKTLRVPRVKSVMNGVAAKIRLASLQPQTFSCPANATSTTSAANCTMNTTFSDLAEVIPGCFSSTMPCGVVVQNIVLTGTTLTADVVYQGEEMSIAPMNLSFEIPTDVLQATDSNCASINPARPVFAGYNADGSLRCLPLPSDCPPGQYASSVNVNNLTLNCIPLPTPANACAANQYMTGVTWNGGPTFTVTCAPRLDPFSYFSFTPTIAVTTTPFSTPTAAPANGTCTPVCVPGATTDTGCVGPGLMGTTNGCSTGTRSEPTCTSTPTTTIPSATTTTLPSTPTTTIPSTPTTTLPATPGTWIRTNYFVDFASHGPGVSCTTGSLPASCCPPPAPDLASWSATLPSCACDSSILGQSVTFGKVYGGAYHEYRYTCSP